MRAFPVLAILLVLCASPAWSDALRVPLAVAEPIGVARTAEPVTVGVPIPAGRLRTTDGLWIAGPDGRATPSQWRVLERWPDGSVRWVLVDFLASVRARESAAYVLRDGAARAASRTPVVETTETATDVRLATGAIAASVPRAATSFVRSIEVGSAVVPVQIPTPVVAVDGVDAESVRDTRLDVETRGPVRTELVLRGRSASDLAYEARLAAFAGTPWLRLQLTLTSLAARPYSRIRSFSFDVTGSGFATALLGLDGAVRRVTLDTPHVLEQPDAQRVVVDGTAATGAGDGWVRAIGESVAVTVVRRYFKEEWPQRLRVARDGIDVDLLAATGDPVELGIGAAKTFELWIAFEPPGHASDPERLAASLQHPLLPHVDPDWVVRSRALPNVIAPDSAGAASFLPRLATAIGRYLARNRAERWDDGAPVPCDERKSEHERIGAYGALNWGDWNFPGYRDRNEGCDAWGNLEYDLTQVLGLAWMATGSRPDWDAFIAAARHYRDVDIIHFAPGHEDIVGINHPHKVKHFAVESPNTIDLGHTWLEGLLTHYRLTGETRSLEAARGIADVLVRRQSKAGNPRQYGWPMIALAAAYDATADVRYRAAAQAYADAAVVTHEPTPAAGDWKMGILADGLAGVHRITGDERLRNWLVGYADALVAAPGRFEDPRYALPLGYLAATTGNARYRALALTTADRMPIGDWGKTLAISGRTGFRLLGGLASAPAPTPAPAAPPRASAGERRRR